MAELEANLNVNTNADKAVNQFKALKNELKDAIGALAGLEEGTAEFNAQAARVGALRDQVNALNDAIANTSGAPVENLTNSFGLLSQQVGTLDFGGAATSLGQFAGSIRSFSFKDLISGAKQLIGTFAQLGKALLANPIFLIAGILIAVGAAVFALKDKIGFLGDAFEVVGNVISDAIKIITDFTDKIGLTTVGIEDKAEKTIAAAKAEQEAVEQRYDKEIAIAGAAGKKTTELEKQKQIEVLKSLKTQLDAIISVGNATGKFTEDQIKQIAELGKAANKADQEIKVGAAKAAKEKEDEDKKNAEKAKANGEKVVADNVKLIKQIRDEQIAAIADENARAIAKANEDKIRRDKDIVDSKASAKIKAEALKASELQLNTDLLAIQKTKDDKAKAEADKKAAEDKARLEAYLAAQKDFNTKSEDLESQLAIKTLEIKLQGTKDVDTKFKLQSQIRQLNLDKELKDISRNNSDQLAAQKKLLDDKIINEQEYADRVKKINENTNAEIKVATDKKNADDVESKKAVREANYAEFQANVAEVQSYVGFAAQAVNGVLDAINEVRQQKRDKELKDIDKNSKAEVAAIDKQLKLGQISKETADKLKYQSEVKRINLENAAKKKAFDEDKKMRIAQTIIAGAQGALTAFTSALSLGPIAGPIVGGILAGVVAASTAVQVANIKQQTFESTSLPSDPGLGSGAGNISTGNVGSQFNADTVGQAGSQNGQPTNNNNTNQNNNVKVYVVESDITNTQNRVKAIESNATIG